MDDLSIMIKIGGKLEKSFNDAIKAAQVGLSGLNAAVSKEMAAAGDTSTAAAMKMADAGRMYAGASKDMAAAARMGATASRRMAAGNREAAASSRDFAAAGKGTTATFKDMAAEGMRAAGAVKDIASTGKVTASSIQDITSALKGVVTGFKDMSTQGRMASRAMQAGGQGATSLSTELAVGGRGITSLSSGMAGAGQMAGAASKGFLVAGAAIAAVAATAAIAGKVMLEVGKYSVQVGMEFETAMSDAAATASASTEEFAKMERAAMEMGKTTSKTASESAKALEYMSLAGWDVDTSISALPSVLKMSEASGMELGQTSDLVTDSMAALGVTVEQLPGYLDVATKAQTKSNQSAQQLMEAYIGVGGTMKNLNVPITESATALGVLANRGLKGAEGGTALNAVMVNLTTGTGQAGKMMQQLGVSAFDQQGKFIGLGATLQQLDTALQGYSEEQRNAALAAIGGKQHMDALNALMAGLNTTNEEGISEWAALRGELDNCNGSLDAMRDKKLDNLEGDLAALQSATQDAGIKIYKHLNAPMREFAQFGTQAVYQVSDALERDGFAGASMAAGDALAEGMGMLIERAPEFLAKAAVSVGSFLVGFATELPADLLTGIIKGAPRLLKALPGLGVDIVKAIIKGIFSIGSAPLKAIGSLLFGDLDDAGIDRAGIDTAKDYPAGIGTDMAAVADIPAVPQGIRDTDMAGTTLPVGEKGISPAGLMDSMAGQGMDIPDILGTPVDMTTGAGQMPVVSMDAVPPVDGMDTKGADMPVVIDAPPVPQAVDGPRDGVLGEMEAGTRISRDVLAGSPAGSLPVPDAGVPQTSIDTGGAVVEPLVRDMGTAGTDAGVTAPSVDVVQDIVPTPSWTLSDIPIEVTQVSSPGTIPDIPMEATQISQDVIPDIPMEVTPDISIEGVQASPGIVPEMPAGVAQTTFEVIPEMSTGAVPDAPIGIAQVSRDVIPDIPIGAVQVPEIEVPDLAMDPVRVPIEVIHAPVDSASDMEQMGGMSVMAGVSDTAPDAVPITTAGTMDSPAMPEVPAQDITIPVPESIRIGDIQIPPVGIDMTGIGDGIARVRDVVRTGLKGGLARQAIEVSGIDVDGATLSDKLGAVGAQGGRALMDGVAKGIGGIVDISQVGIDMTGIDVGKALGIPQVPLQGEVQAVTGGTLHDAVPDMTVAQDTAKGAGEMTGISPGPLPVVTVAQEPAEGIGVVYGWIRDIADTIRDVLRLPDMDTLSSRSVVEETLDAIVGKMRGLDSPTPDVAPSFTLNLTIHVEGKEDVEDRVIGASRIGMREFERCMEGWMRKYRRTGFGKGINEMFT